MPAQDAPVDVSVAYAEALAAGTNGPEMLRLLSRTGVAWAQLKPDVASRLLTAFVHMLRVCALLQLRPAAAMRPIVAHSGCCCHSPQDPLLMPRVLPWLWRLADPHQSPPLPGGEGGAPPAELQSQLLASLAALCDALRGTDPEVRPVEALRP
jgi:hypothetical protein